MRFQPGVSRYGALAAMLRARIESGELRPGDPLPSESTLAAEHEMTRETVRRAISMLRAWGLVDTTHGRRTTVRLEQERTEVPIQRGASWIVRMPTAAEQASFELDDGVPVLEVRHGAKVRVYPGDRYTFLSR